MEKDMRTLLVTIGVLLVCISNVADLPSHWHELLTNLGSFLAGSQMIRRLGDKK